MKIQAAIARDPGKLSYETLTLDVPRPNEILVRVVATGICHTDLSAINQLLPARLPMVPGHEGAGIVEAVGSAVTKVAPGDHVVMTYDYCDDCRACRDHDHTYCHHAVERCFLGDRPDGSSTLFDAQDAVVHGSFFGQSSLATYALCYDRNVIKVRKDAPLDVLGPLACGIQTGAGAVFNALGVTKQTDFAVFGAGAVGLSAVMAAHVAGAPTIIAVDISEERLEMARDFGATHVFNSRTEDPVAFIQSVTEGGVLRSLDTSGVPTVMQQALAATAPRGTCGWLAGVDPALEVPINPTFLLAGRSVKGIIEGESHDAQTFITKLVDLYMEGRFPFDKMCQFYEMDQLEQALVDSKSGATIKPIIRFHAQN
ncbi:NAD(P)-dependent alcohol dehydrogenase [Celeribacter baekdonensis]|uniref:NAD(P)-dependent alcohol dehydrogenase n=1 Tax=Celeribacter baekdonensis TaxID=875171 RepID=A0A2R4LY08_9RHOB|nr:NAD(P)-dependent alcohol dehydrogenase [Celeribacter baekdonensis]AVW89742.1 NAD(P)-dependent alcohol dehydrogenase [Celeribacter baekdonensis]